MQARFPDLRKESYLFSVREFVGNIANVGILGVLFSRLSLLSVQGRRWAASGDDMLVKDFVLHRWLSEITKHMKPRVPSFNLLV